MNKQSLKSLLISMLVVAAVAFASNLTIPFSFSAGNTTSASDMNANFAAVKTAVDDNDARINALLAPPVYTVPTLATGWVNIGTGWSQAGFTKDPLGIVRLRGLIKRTSGTANIIFTLPAGYAPTKVVQFPARCGNDTMCAVMVHSSGAVEYYGAGAASGLTLDGMTYDPR